jgi:hypothetical protein
MNELRIKHETLACINTQFVAGDLVEVFESFAPKEIKSIGMVVGTEREGRLEIVNSDGNLDHVHAFKVKKLKLDKSIQNSIDKKFYEIIS